MSLKTNTKVILYILGLFIGLVLFVVASLAKWVSANLISGLALGTATLLFVWPLIGYVRHELVHHFGRRPWPKWAFALCIWVVPTLAVWAVPTARDHVTMENARRFY